VISSQGLSERRLEIRHARVSGSTGSNHRRLLGPIGISHAPAKAEARYYAEQNEFAWWRLKLISLRQTRYGLTAIRISGFIRARSSLGEAPGRRLHGSTILRFKG
jgi:hypothetical protein